MGLPTHVTRDKVLALEAAIIAMDAPADVRTTHHFDHGVYQRGMFVPAGTAVTGKIHLHQNLLVLAKGAAMLLSGPEPVRVKAPWACVSEGGVKRVAIAITDCYFISYVETEDTDPERIAQATVVDTFAQYDTLQGEAHVIHGGNSSGRIGSDCNQHGGEFGFLQGGGGGVTGPDGRGQEGQECPATGGELKAGSGPASAEYTK